MEERPVTAGSIAASFFQQDLANHDKQKIQSDTVVILQDACYGHRFAKPSTKKAAEQALEFTFERPERIEATAMGVAAAYVFLGERHADGQHAPHPKRSPPEQLPFRIRKTSRSIPLQSPIVTAVHGSKWMAELSQMCGMAAEKLPHGKELERIKSVGSKAPAKEQLHAGDLYLCPESLAAFEGALGGVCDGVDAVFTGTALGNGPHRAFVSIRPPGHHCSATMPSGFCWLNNVHVGIEYAARHHGVTHAAIIDFDLHHGDGSQAITWARNNKGLEATIPSESARNQEAKPRNYSENFPIGYFSVHDIDSYPCETHNPVAVANASICVDNHHGQSIWNVHLEDWDTETEFWAAYEQKYRTLIDKMRNFLRHHTAEINMQLREQANQPCKKNDRSKSRNVPEPKAVIFISAGFDASEHEISLMQRHGKRVMTEFYARISKDIVALAAEEGTAVDGRIISVLEGGYSNKALMSGVLSHLSGLCDDRDQTTPEMQPPSSLGSLGLDLAYHFDKMRIKEEEGLHTEPFIASGVNYDIRWWAHTNLMALERFLQPKEAPLPVIQVTKSARPGGFFEATKASAAKIVEPSKVHRTASWSSQRSRTSMSTSPSRPTTPPPPEVDWLTAVHELSKLLVPLDRQTKSLTPDELCGGPKPKKARHTTIGLPSTEEMATTGFGRQLRDRKVKVSNYQALENPKVDGAAGSSDDDRSSLRSVSRSERRKTIGDLPSNGTDQTSNTSRRRSSAASTISATSIPLKISTVTNGQPKKPSTTIPPDGSTVQVRKTRAGSAAPSSRTTTAKFSNMPPVPRVPSGYMDHASSTRRPDGTSKTEQTDKNMEELSTGLKKIKIHVPSNEEFAARQQAKKTATSRLGTTKASNTKVMPTTKTTAATKRPPPKSKGRQNANTQSGATRSPPAASATPPSTSRNAAPLSKPDDKTPSAPVAETEDGTPPEQELLTETPHPSVPALQFQQEYPMSTQTVPPSSAGPQQLNWQTPNKDVPEVPSSSNATPKLVADGTSSNSVQQTAAAFEANGIQLPAAQGPLDKKKPLPQWSATGHIPFAGGDSAGANQVGSAVGENGVKDAQAVDMWAVPDTPQK